MSSVLSGLKSVKTIKTRENGQKRSHKFTPCWPPIHENSLIKESNEIIALWSQIRENSQKSSKRFTSFWSEIRENGQKSRKRFISF